MGLIGSIRRAEERSKKVAKRSMEHAMESLEDTERAVRRRMRIYPQHPAPTANQKEKRRNVPSDGGSIPVEDSEGEGKKAA